MGEMLKMDKGPFQMLFGDDASADPNLIFPIVLICFIVLLVMALRIVMKDKGKSEMSDEELEKDRRFFDERMHRQAGYAGEEYDPARHREQEAREIAEANRRWGKK